MARSRRDRRTNERSSRTGILLGVAGALIAALLVYQVFLKGDDTPTAATSSARPAVSAPVAGDGTTTTTAPLEPELPNGSFDELSLRDPFEPIGTVDSGGDGGATVETTPTTSPTSDTFPTTPTTSPTQNPVPTSEVALLDVTTDANGVKTARVRVSGTEYTVVAGQTFGPASNYVLVAFTSDSCASFTYADSPFSLCTGEQVLK